MSNRWERRPVHTPRARRYPGRPAGDGLGVLYEATRPEDDGADVVAEVLDVLRATGEPEPML